MEGVPKPQGDSNLGPPVVAASASGPPPSMVKSGISTIEDLCSKDEKPQCPEAEITEKTNVTEVVGSIPGTVEEIQKSVEIQKTVGSSSNQNCGNPIPDVAIVLVHNH